MVTTEPTTDALAQILASHRLSSGYTVDRAPWFTCGCGWQPQVVGNQFVAYEEHCAHVAEVLAAYVRTKQAEALREAARHYDTRMADVWGGGQSWLTNGVKVASLVAGGLRERADEIEGAQ